MSDPVILAKNNLERAIQDAITRRLPDPGHRWNTYARHVRSEIETIVTPQEAIWFAQDPDRHGGFEARHQTAQLRASLRQQDQFLQDTFPQFADKLVTFGETPLAISNSVVLHRGRLVSSPLYSHSRFIQRSLSFCTPDRVLEIGGGYGAPGRLWMTNGIMTPSLYCDVDLPESLFFAEVYLREHFGNDAVAYVHDETDVDEIGRDVMFLLCPPHNISYLEHAGLDLVLNTLSMGEMGEE